MARTSSKPKADEQVEKPAEATVESAAQEQEEKAGADTSEPKADEQVEKLMKLYPNLKGMWITPDGFVHSEGVPEHYRKGAKFYKNKYYKQ